MVPVVPLPEGESLIGLIASALTLLAATRRRPQVRSATRTAATGVRGADAVTLAAGKSSDDDESDEVDREEAGGEVASVATGFGDRHTDERPDRIRPPHVRAIDRMMLQVAMAIDSRMPLAARTSDDAAYARSLFGIAWVLLPVAGAVLGVVSAFDTDFTMMIPSLGLVLVSVIIGTLDAFAGAVFVTAFGVSMLLGGGFDSVGSVRGFLGIAVFTFGPALVAASVRPFRRATTGDGDLWERTVDLVLLALFGSWAAGTMYSAIPALTTYKPAHSDRVDLIHVVVLVTLVARWLLENAARTLTPRRLREVELEDFDEPSRTQRMVSNVLRTAVFVFVAVAFIGNNWALWTGGVLFLAPKIVDEFADRFPNIEWLHRWVPRDLARTVIMLFVALWWGNLVNDALGDSANMILWAFVVMGIPGHVLGVIDWLGRESKGWPSTLLSKAAGTVMLVIGILMVRGYLF